MKTYLTDEQWMQYTRDGYLKLGKLLDDQQLTELQNRIDDIMLGKVNIDYDRLLMQLDSDSGKYEDAPAQTKGHKGATLNYRKIQDLEWDPVFLRYMQWPIFREICVRTYGMHVPVGCYRAMFFNKPAHKGTFLPWHQDRWNSLDRDPLVTVWTALDPATIDNGCVQIIPGSHRFGVVNPAHGAGFMTPEQAAELCKPQDRVHLELKPGEVALMHNWLMHSSDVNKTDTPRRAFSACYLDARTTCKRSNEKFPVIFGENALTPEQVEVVASK